MDRKVSIALKRLKRLYPDAGCTLDFVTFDATGLADPKASHLTKLRFELVDSSHVKMTETYEEKGKLDVSDLLLTANTPR